MPESNDVDSPPRGASTTVLAFDFGEKRIGVAVGETALKSAHALTVIAAEDNSTRFEAIAALVREWRPGLLIVGLPAHPDGAEHEVSRLARRFARRLEGRFGVRTVLVDERYSSASAESVLREQGLSGERLKAALDAAAATEILRTYFGAAPDAPQM